MRYFVTGVFEAPAAVDVQSLMGRRGTSVKQPAISQHKHQCLVVVGGQDALFCSKDT